MRAPPSAATPCAAAAVCAKGGPPPIPTSTRDLPPPNQRCPAPETGPSRLDLRSFALKSQTSLPGTCCHIGVSPREPTHVPHAPSTPAPLRLARCHANTSSTYYYRVERPRGLPPLTARSDATRGMSRGGHPYRVTEGPRGIPDLRRPCDWPPPLLIHRGPIITEWNGYAHSWGARRCASSRCALPHRPCRFAAKSTCTDSRVVCANGCELSHAARMGELASIVCVC